MQNMASILKPLLKLMKPQKPASKPIKINTITANRFNNFLAKVIPELSMNDMFYKDFASAFTGSANTAFTIDFQDF